MGGSGAGHSHNPESKCVLKFCVLDIPLTSKEPQLSSEGGHTERLKGRRSRKEGAVNLDGPYLGPVSHSPVWRTVCPGTGLTG